MGHKRKRSCSESSPSSISTSTSSFLSSPSRTSTSPSPNPYQLFGNAMPSNSNASLWNLPRGEPLAARLNSRTRKRVRNRPDEESIHESTIHKLFDAQRQHPDPSPVQSRAEAPVHQPNVQQSTLHSFWRLPQPPSHIALADAHFSLLDHQDETHCEDCDRALPTTDGMDVDVVALDVADECACRNCGRKVCDLCAVNMNGRQCLACVMSRR